MKMPRQDPYELIGQELCVSAPKYYGGRSSITFENLPLRQIFCEYLMHLLSPKVIGDRGRDEVHPKDYCIVIILSL